MLHRTIGVKTHAALQQLVLPRVAG